MMASLAVILFSTKCFLFVYMYIDLLKLKAYKLFESSDADPAFVHPLTAQSQVQTTQYNPFSNKPWFLRVNSTRLLKTVWEKEILLIMSNFSFFHSVFYLFGDISAIFIRFEIVICNLFQFGRV